ncbi:hypothetical protein P296_04660 [Salmonella enterica subsp. arizonae serovar 18:z4,z23:- str. CVM N26624]|uniref:Uncharacterized protein n=1 Tax=Salmonella enterica subsp. arizonae serovar 18:z4,z23:- str. CVM N26626 TaxID=1395119 RepID=A0A3S5YQT8_SALER|nr:hypothetical protein P296_04660 [Salmonella enterica subsp. arizonae serovar 18:z4,z23:- str. CVM N26624]OLV99350.1 hypothetical protein P297_14345 [Salmonella enterica subsp. arizonae serovar 18:z4,z23:- str. CVM N26625]OLW05149.1 hypothetical protein P298_05910 [Salmonella enterica subsp. arizonae serovar 18:z4,z23:- str. CVM N26626]OLW12626.1 hypothetical protein P295_07575 [Salmonella enterica subsp. arizonae serovar 18:z4,z23:- str. CVM N25373]OLW15612.1 hypothetical protein P293_07240 
MKGNNLTDVIPPNGRWYLVPRMGASIRIGAIALGSFRLGGLIFHLFMWETFQSSQATEVSTVLAALPLSFWMVSAFL